MDRARVVEHCADANLVLEYCGIQRVHVAIGWCTGARLLLHLATTGTVAIGRVLLLNGAYVFDDVPLTVFQAQLHEVLARLAQDHRMASVLYAVLQRGLLRGGRFSDDAALAQIVGYPFQEPDRLLRYAALFRDVASPTHELALAARLKIPVTFVAGSEDEVTAAEASRLIAAATPNAKYLELANGTHYIPYTHAHRLPLWQPSENAARVLVDDGM